MGSEASWADRFERFLRLYRRDDGSEWSGAALERATGGAVSRSYVSKLRLGKTEDPSYEKIYAISKAMDIPLEAWMENTEDS